MLRLEESILSILDSQFVELFPDLVIANVYSESKLNHPFEKLIYDETEDNTISILYAADGEYDLSYPIPFYVCKWIQDATSSNYCVSEHMTETI